MLSSASPPLINYLMTDRTSYYEYTPDSSGTWHLKTPPERNIEVERHLTQLAGRNFRSEPNLRVTWAGRAKDADGFLKYKQDWRGLTHFKYLSDSGEELAVKTERDVPENKLAIPVYGQIELGRPRWIVERFDQRRNDYAAYFVVETADKKFRDLDMNVFEAVAGMWHYNRQTSEAQKQLDDITREADATRRMNEEARREWEKELSKEDLEEANEIIRLEEESLAREEAEVLYFT